MSDGSKLKSKDLIIKFQTSILKEVKEAIKKEPIEKSFDALVEKYPYKVIYKYLAR